ncbi:hypothetical protein AWV80_15120 [Cupriavidus sp. UYMU48A]|nr:hypothetical protein AWV80_15120 [Cupriavidus sp. UYMU48A]
MERFITAPVWFDGEPDGSGVLRNAQMKPSADYRPTLRLASLDIETNAFGELYSIAIEGCGQRQVYMLGPPPAISAEVDFSLEYCETRPALLEKLNQWLARQTLMRSSAGIWSSSTCACCTNMPAGSL